MGSSKAGPGDAKLVALCCELLSTLVQGVNRMLLIGHSSAGLVEAKLVTLCSKLLFTLVRGVNGVLFIGSSQAGTVDAKLVILCCELLFTLVRGVNGMLLKGSSRAGPADAKSVVLCRTLLFTLVRIMVPDKPKSSSIAVSVVPCGPLRFASGETLSNTLPGTPTKFTGGAVGVRFLGCPLALHKLAATGFERPEC